MSTLPPCDPNIFRNGSPVFLLDARSAAAEAWVRALAQRTGVRIDWHYSGGIAQVLFLGTEEDRARIIEQRGPSNHEVRVMRIFDSGAGGGLYRAGVDTLPDDVIGVSYDI